MLEAYKARRDNKANGIDLLQALLDAAQSAPALANDISNTKRYCVTPVTLLRRTEHRGLAALRAVSADLSAWNRQQRPYRIADSSSCRATHQACLRTAIRN